MNFARHLLCGSLFLASLVPLYGVPIFSQPVSPGASNRSSSTLNFLGQAPGFETFMAFTPAANASVTDLNWWGISQAGGMDFRVSFYAGGATPGAVLATYSVSPTVTAAPGPPPDLLFYTAFLSSPFSVKGGTEYWLSIFNAAPNANWAWQGSPTGSVLQRELGATAFSSVPVGVAFTLNDNSVPEPSTGILLGLGIMLVAGRGWSKRRQG